MSDWLPYPWQQESWQRLVQPLQQQRMPHALLVSGEKGGGKQFLMDGFAKKALCQQQQDYACGQCKSCQLFAAGTHPDYSLLLPDGKNIKIDQVRSMIEQLGQTAHLGGMKVVMLVPAEAMNIASANALLKCLEEPTPNTLIILVSHSPHRLLPTIRSRCQQMVMPKPELMQADQWLQVFVGDAAQRAQLLQLANGNPLLARDYFEQDMLALYQKSQSLLRAFADGQGNIVREADEIVRQTGKIAGTQKSEGLEQWLRINQLLLWQMIRRTLNVDENPLWLKPLLPILHKPLFIRQAYRLLEHIQQGLKEMQGAGNPNPQLLVESLLIRWQQLLAH